MVRALLMVGLASASAGFFAGHRGRPSIPPIVVQLPDPEVWAVSRGHRAVSIEVKARAPALAVGDHVDVLSIAPDPQAQELAVRTVAQNAAIIGAADSGPGRQRISLLVEPDVAYALALADGVGGVEVMLRHPEDAEVLAPRPPRTLASLLSNVPRTGPLRLRHVHAGPRE